jgi:hypothetical protein
MASGLLPITVDLIGARGALGRFESMAATGVRDEMVVVAEGLREEIERLYREAAPRRKDSGDRPPRAAQTFAESIEARLVETGDGFTLSVGTSQGDLAQWIREGTRAHEIVPRQARALSFFWPRAGAHVTFARVWHPGTRPNPWESKPREAAEQLVRDRAKSWAQRIISRLESSG